MAEESRIQIIVEAIVDQAEKAMMGLASTVQKSVDTIQSASTGMSGVMGGVANGVQGFVGSVQSFFSSIGTSINNLISDATLASGVLTTAFTLVGKNAIEVAGDFEKVGVMTKFLTKTPADAEKFTKSLIDLAIGSQFTTKEITTLGTRTIGIVPDVDKATLFMNSLTNAVSATGGGVMELNNAQRALTQTYIKAHPALEELNKQFTNAQIPIMQVMAEALSSGAVKLKGYTDGLSSMGTVSTKTAKQIASAKDGLKEANDQLAIQKQALIDATATHAKTVTSTQHYTTGVKDLQNKVAKLNNTINENNQWLTDAASKNNISAETVLKHRNAISEAQTKISSLNATLVNHTNTTKNVIQVNNTQKSTLMGLNNQIENSQEKIAKYNNVLATSSAAGSKGFHKSVEEIKADLQDPDILKGFAGSDFATAAAEAMMWKWKEANKVMLSTFQGSSRNIVDQVEVIEAMILGLDKSFGIKEGSIFYYLKKGVVDLSNALTNHRQDIVNFFTGIALNKDILIGIAAVIATLVTPAFLWLLKPWLSMGLLLPILTPLFFALGKAGKYIYEHWDKIAPIFEPLKKAFSDFILSIGEKIKKIPEQLETMKGQIITKVQELKNLFVFGEVDPPKFATWSDVFEKAKKDFEEFKTKLEPIIADLKIKLDELFKVIKPVAEDLIEDFGKLAKVIVGVFVIAWDFLSKKLEESSPWIDKTLKWLAEHHKDVATAIEAVALVITGFLVVAFTSWAISATAAAIATALAMLPITLLILSLTLLAFMVIKYWNQIKAAFEIGKTWIEDRMKESGMAMVNFKNAVEGIVKPIVSAFNSIGTAIQGTIDKFREWTGLDSKGTKGMILPLPQQQHGGIIPGPIGAPIPIMAHGGEMVTPTTGIVDRGNTGGGGITININGSLSVDSEDRVRQLAYQIVRILGRQNELSRYGVGYATGF